MKMMKKMLTAMLCALLFISSFVSARAASDTVTITFEAAYLQDDARTMLSKINAFRTGSEAWAWDSTNTKKVWYTGLGALTYDYGLEKIAMQRAKELAVYYSHTRPDGSKNTTAYTSGYTSLCGENIAWGFSTVDSMFNRWKEDDYNYSGQAHRRNMLKAGFKSVGIGCVMYNGTKYWVMELSSAVQNTTKVSYSSSDQSMSVKVLKSLLSMDVYFDNSEYKDNAKVVINLGDEIDVPTFSTYIYANAGFFKVNPAVTITSSNTESAVIQDGKISGIKGGWSDIKFNLNYQGMTKTVTLKLGVSGPGEDHIHVYEISSMEWDEPYVTANAIFVCKFDSSHILTLPCTVTREVTPPTCTQSGMEYYEVSVTYEGETYYGYDRVYLEPLPHEWTDAVYMWSDDYSSVTGTVRCKVGGELEEETAYSSYELVREATETEPGLGVYTAVFSNTEHFETQTLEVEIPVIGAPAPESISLSETAAVMATETVLPLIAELMPELADQSVTWTSGNKNTAIVDAAGNVRALRYGTAVITATSKANPSLSASCSIETRYFDVADQALYYYTPVYWAADREITKGYDNVYFGPKNSCTREAVVTFLWRLAGKPNPKSMSSPFWDVQDSSKYYYKAVLWAAEQGITNGYSNGAFRPNDTCLREHVVTFLWRYAKKPTPNTTVNPFNDIQSTDYYYKAVLWANEKGIANGYSEGQYAGGFGPKLDCLREHVVTFLYRYACIK